MANDLDFLKGQLRGDDAQALAKAITSATGAVGYNLEPEVALLIPYVAFWRSRVPTDKAKQGALQSTWKIQKSLGGADLGAWGSAEKNIGPATAPDIVQLQAPYLSQAFTGNVSLTAIDMAVGFDDPLSIETSNVLTLSLGREELISLTGNYDAISAPAPVVTPSTLQTAGTFAAGTWHVKVTAITNEGAYNNNTSNSTIGESAPSASIAVVVPSGGSDFLNVSVPAIPNVVGYKFYIERTAGGGTFYLCDPATTLRYRKITSGTTDLTALGDPIVILSTGQTYVGVDQVQIYAIPPNTQPTAPTGDHSANTNVAEGAFAWASKSTIYNQSGWNHYNVDLQGAPFTHVGTGIQEIDYVLQNQFNFNKMFPSLIIGSPATVNAISNVLVQTGTVSPYWMDITQKQGSFAGGIFMGGYTNKFAGQMIPGAQPVIPVWSHPYLPDGNLMILSENIPAATYKFSRKGKAFSLDVLRPYTYWDLAHTEISIPFSILWTQTLQCHHPSAQSVIQGARVA